MPPTDSHLPAIWGALLAEKRQAAGLSRQQLADEVGVTLPSITKLELGQHKPTDRLRMALAAALDTTVPDLFPHVPADAA